MKYCLAFVLSLFIQSSFSQNATINKEKGADGDTQKLVITKAKLLDKIRGGWAGQVIGVTYGGPTEFRFNGTMVNQYVPIPWYDGYVKKTMIENAGLYDDLYMDLTFVEVFEKYGID